MPDPAARSSRSVPVPRPSFTSTVQALALPETEVTAAPAIPVVTTRKLAAVTPRTASLNVTVYTTGFDIVGDGSARAIAKTVGGIASAITVKPCDTVGAGMKLSLPAWFASMVQAPGATRCTTPAKTVQTTGVAELNVTGKPEV